MSPERVVAPVRTVHAAPGFLPWVAELVHRHRSELLGFARRKGLGAEDALDAVQDAFASFLRLPEAREIARDGDDAVRMLTVILRHQVFNVRRKAGRHARGEALLELQTTGAETETSEALISRAEELARVSGCILRMSRLQQSVVRLSLVDEQPRDEVARELGISEGYLRVLLHRAREHVRHCDFEVPTPAEEV